MLFIFSFHFEWATQFSSTCHYITYFTLLLLLSSLSVGENFSTPTLDVRQQSLLFRVHFLSLPTNLSVSFLPTTTPSSLRLALLKDSNGDETIQLSVNISNSGHFLVWKQILGDGISYLWQHETPKFAHFNAYHSIKWQSDGDILHFQIHFEPLPVQYTDSPVIETRLVAVHRKFIDMLNSATLAINSKWHWLSHEIPISTGHLICVEGKKENIQMVSNMALWPQSTECDRLLLDNQTISVSYPFRIASYISKERKLERFRRAPGPCEPNPCKNNRSCVVKGTGFECQCSDKLDLNWLKVTKVIETGWTGTNCETNINECTQSPCQNDGRCEDTTGSFRCNCGLATDGFTYIGSFCQDLVDMCTVIKPNIPLPRCVNGNCTNSNKDPFFSCACASGWRGQRCEEDIDECKPNNICQNGGICTNLPGTFNCQCLVGFNGTRCENNIDDCVGNPCANRGRCLDGINSFTCNCTGTGFEGPNCTIEINECDRFKKCQNGANCTDRINDYSCQCWPGYRGKDCEEDIDECSLYKPCVNGACLQLSNRTLYNMTYKNLPPFVKPFSYNNAVGYYCDCIAGYEGKNCSQEIDECASSPCLNGGNCTDALANFTCACPKGFTGLTCEININDCAVNPCKNGGVCKDLVNDYQCNCLQTGNPVFGGRNCTIQLTGCNTTDFECSNDSPCVPTYNETTSRHSYACKCPPGFSRRRCDFDTSMSMIGGVGRLILRSDKLMQKTFLYSLELTFQTVLMNALLFFVQFPGTMKLFVAMDIRNSGIRLSGSFGEMYILPPNTIPYQRDPLWRKVDVTFNYLHFPGNSTIGLYLDVNIDNTGLAAGIKGSVKNFPVGSIPSSGRTEETVATKWELVLGDLSTSNITAGVITNEMKRSSWSPYRGCIRDVYINGIPTSSDFRFGLLTKTLVHFSDIRQVEVIRVYSCNTIRGYPCDGNCPLPRSSSCLDLWDASLCMCNRGYGGDSCDAISPATFGYSEKLNFVQFTLTRPDIQTTLAQSRNVSFFLTTRNPSQYLYYLGTDSAITSDNATSFISVWMENGDFVIRLQRVGLPLQTQSITSANWADGVTRLISINVWTSNQLSIVLSAQGSVYSMNVTNSSTAMSDFWNVPYTVFYVGGFDKLLPPKFTLTRFRRAPDVVVPTNAYPANMSSLKGVLQDPMLNQFKTTIVPLNMKLDNAVLPSGASNVEPGILNDDVCRRLNGVCLNGGNCSVVFYNDYVCACPPGWVGKNCSQKDFCYPGKVCPDSYQCSSLPDRFKCVASRTFDGKTSKATFNPSNIAPTTNFSRMFVSIRTGVGKGVIFHMANAAGHFVTLALNNGVLRASASIGVKNYIKDYSPATIDVSNGQWHNISVTISSNDITLTVDDPRSYIVDSVEPSIGISNLAFVRLGVKGDEQPEFKGCIQDMQLNDRYPLSYHPLIEIQKSLSQFILAGSGTVNLKDGCAGEDTCAPKPCMNGGNCTNKFNDYQCFCDTGYIGANCQFLTCSKISCLYDSTCVLNCPTGVTVCKPEEYGFKCNCKTNRAGLRCQLVDLCVTGGVPKMDLPPPDQQVSPCKNKAPCTSIWNITATQPQADYNCSCPPQWKGKNCDEVVLSPETVNQASVNTGLIIGLCVGFLVLIIIIIIILLVRHVRQKRVEQATYSPQTIQESNNTSLARSAVLKTPTPERLI